MKKRAAPAKSAKSRAPASRRTRRPQGPGRWISEREYAGLCERLREAQETLEAIQSGSVDAVVIKGESGSQIYSLTGAEQRYRIYVEQMQEGAITASEEGLILYCNQRFADMVKLPLERVIGASILHHFPADSWAKISTVFTEQRDVVKHESLLACPDGAHVAVHLTASRMPALEQNILCVVVTDLTEQKDRQGLQLAKDLADKSNLAKDAFLAALSHELRTPLTPALMTVVALERSKGLPARVRRDLAMIRRNIELEARLIDDLLDLTRIAKGKLELRVAALDFHTVIERAIEICLPDLKAKSQKLKRSLDARATATTGDVVRVQQALWNLIRNAVKFTPPGGIITIRTGNAGLTGVWVQVCDTGVGFQPHESHKLFEAFEQGGRHITRQFGGLGLGLAISTAIVAAHHGTLRAESRGTNLGATFTLELPLLAPAPLSLPPSFGAVLASPGARSLRILLVEDHKDTRLTLQLCLQAAKHEVIAVGTAEDALAAAGAHEFDLVISDLGLPDDGGGLAMMRLLRQRHRLKGIAVSGYGMEEDIAQSRAAGFSHHLTKPFGLERLKNLIVEISKEK